LENVKFPPPQLPIPVRSGSYRLRQELFQSDTKEMLLALDIYVLFDSKPKKLGVNV
jgi:hypothetical protein